MRSLQRGDLAGRSAFYESMFDRGVFSPNDIRHAEGMNPIPDAEGGNKRFVMVNMQTLESAGTPDPSTGSERASRGTRRARRTTTTRVRRSRAAEARAARRAGPGRAD